MEHEYSPLLHRPPVDEAVTHRRDSIGARAKRFFRIFRPGFTKRYNVWLCMWFSRKYPSPLSCRESGRCANFCVLSTIVSISAFGMAFFSLARFKYLSISILASELTPGDWYWYRHGPRHVGFILHLAAMLPAGLLMILQFIPRIRHRFLFFHRVNGYTVLVLCLIGNVTALVIARRAFGGGVGGQSATGMLALISTIAMGLAWFNIRRLQIDQHRAWMLRAMFWMGSIVSTRLIMPPASIIMTALGGYYTAWSCDQIQFVLGGREPLLAQFPQCGLKNGTTDGYVAVKAELNFSNPTGLGAVFDSNFGMGVSVFAR